MCTSPSSSTTAVTGMTTDGSRMEWLKWIQWIRWPGPYKSHCLSVPERSQTYPDMKTPCSQPPLRRRSCPHRLVPGRFVIRATHERGVGVPSSRSLATASREAFSV